MITTDAFDFYAGRMDEFVNVSMMAKSMIATHTKHASGASQV
ncbi:MAG: hypothetical protein ACLGRW_18560 [Acidobacteriota bacterium]